jgi:hypothetical protein
MAEKLKIKCVTGPIPEKKLDELMAKTSFITIIHGKDLPEVMQLVNDLHAEPQTQVIYVHHYSEKKETVIGIRYIKEGS